MLDLFSGIGGFSLGLERAGMKTAAFCEIEPYCRRMLAHHWPGVPCFPDVKGLNVNTYPHLADVICGGFPCQGLSLAGLGLGLADVRSALWFEYLRIITEFRPRWVIIENVPALRSRGLDVVLGGLAAIGYDAEWHCIPAAAFGAPHRRDRIWIVAYPASFGCGERWEGRLTDRLAWIRNRPRWHPTDADYAGLEVWESERGDARPQCPAIERDANEDVWQSRWTDEPALCGVDDGVSSGVDVGLYALGNSIVPQIAEAIGRAIIDWEGEHAHD